MRKTSFSTKCLSALPLILTVTTAISDLPHSSGTFSSSSSSSRQQSAVAPTAVSITTTIPRGGGWFGFGNNGNNRRNNNNNGNDDDDGNVPHKKRFPAMTQEEIEAKLDSVPVFGITSQGSNGIAVGSVPDQGDMVYFFLSQEMAQQALQSMQASNQGLKLQITTLSLGKIWFKLLQNENSMIDCTPLQGGTQSQQSQSQSQQKNVRKKVSFRLVAGARDYFLARLLTSLSPNEAEQLRLAVQADAKDKARDIVTKATSANNKGAFSSPYNEIPLFMMPQMRVQLKEEEQEPGDDGEMSPKKNTNGMVTGTALPMFLSAKDMIQAYLRTNPNHPTLEDVKSMSFPPSEPAPTIQLVELHQLVKLMQEDSDFDFRSVVLFTPSSDDNNNNDDDDNDGGGGDFGLPADNNEYVEEDEVQVEMFECTPYEWDGYGSLQAVS